MIGVIYPFSGASAQIGVDAQKSYETALDIINKNHDFDLPLAKGEGLPGLGGAKVRLVFADHQADPQKGRAETERLITQEKVCAVIGTYQSSVAVTVSQICERYQIPFISADNSSPSLHRRGLKFYFRAAPHDEMFSAAMFNFFDAMKKKGTKIDTLSLFHEDTIFGTDSANAQLKLAGDRGYKVVADIKYRSNSPSLSAEVQQLKTANADVLMPSSYTTDGILLVKTMAELGYKPNAIVAQDAGFSEKALYDAVGDKLEGVISRGSFSLDLAAKRPMVGKINAMFKEKSGKDFNDLTSRQFMGLLVMADAINRAKSTDGEKIREAIGRGMARPRLLMLDEPSQGIMPKLVDEIFQAVKRIRDAGMTVLIVEQRMSECLEIADRAYILQTGRVLMQGSAADISVNPDVRKAYLGL